jgi:hypothetical protein
MSVFFPHDVGFMISETTANIMKKQQLARSGQEAIVLKKYRF